MFGGARAEKPYGPDPSSGSAEYFRASSMDSIPRLAHHLRVIYECMWFYTVKNVGSYLRVIYECIWLYTVKNVGS